ncbi:MAG: hypothetical protein NC124_20020 [Clostridium sp.]|nr:hypothetical protein [Clostridium sp.]
MSYYHRDEQRSTAFITNTEGEIQNSYLYDVFGATLEVKEQFQNRIRYTGQQYDDLTGQYYLRARYYNPVLGIFLQEDTYQGNGLNLYAYCGNNPVVYCDPSGYAQEVVPCGGDGNIDDGQGQNNNNLDGYYQDDDGDWHRPNGQYASNAEVGISNTTPTNASGTHGNSLDDPRTNYGYVLTDQDTGEILKFGESINPDTRYSKSYLEENNCNNNNIRARK